MPYSGSKRLAQARAVVDRLVPLVRAYGLEDGDGSVRVWVHPPWSAVVREGVSVAVRRGERRVMELEHSGGVWWVRRLGSGSVELAELLAELAGQCA